MDAGYAVVPFVTWLITGTIKFMVNSIKAGKPAFSLIGYGGFPSNHAAIVTGCAFLIFLREGVDHPAFCVALTLAFIVMMDAKSLRREVGKHAREINKLNELEKPLRERMGHTPVEIAGGVVTGMFSSWLVYLIS